MIVIDGISQGHRLCGFPACPNPPANYSTASLCMVHTETHGSRCAVQGCMLPRALPSKMCNTPAHQESWLKHIETFTRVFFQGMSRVMRQRRGQESNGAAFRAEPWQVNGMQRYREAGRTQVDEDPENQIQHDAQPASPPLPPSQAEPAIPAIKHTIRYRRINCIEVATWPCGCPIAWAKFANSESPSNIRHFLEALAPADGQYCRWSFITIDKACRLVLNLIASGVIWSWYETTRFLVDIFHYGNHTDEVVCATHCNPAPMDGTQPNLVIPFLDKKGKLQMRRAFNMEASEQLNSWFGGYSKQLSHMRAENHDFLIQVMLEKRFKMRAEELPDFP